MYSFSTELKGDLNTIESQLVDALQAEGFGIMTEIDVQATMEKKLGIHGKPYKILGACNPSLAHQAIEAEPNIGLLLPCNVVIRESDSGSFIVAFMDPASVLTLVGRDDIAELAQEVRDRLERVKQALGGKSVHDETIS